MSNRLKAENREAEIIARHFGKEKAATRQSGEQLTAIHSVLDQSDPEAQFDPLSPSCERCGDSMDLDEGCEWSETPGANVCHMCAKTMLVEIRQIMGMPT